MLTIDDIIPDKVTYRPGETARIRVTVSNDGHMAVGACLTLALTHFVTTVEQLTETVRFEPNARTVVQFAFTPPPVPLRGYGLDATLHDEAGQVLAEGSGALDVLERWSQAPRYGFLSDFAPGQTGVGERCDSLLRYHLNVVQFYDWMWRHYKLLPPSEEFTDGMGRRLSLNAVRAAIEGVQARGGAAMAYGAVYGAEPEFAEEHPELVLYDEAGERVSLAGLFYIMNIASDSPWVPLIVSEFAEAVRVMGFDGIHLDQYGFPKTAVTASGEKVELAEHFPLLIDQARAAVVSVRDDAGVIFNAVENWPIETVAPTSQDAVYIEVWPPDVSYNDLRRLIREGRRLSGGKQVILAAYLSPFLGTGPDTDTQTLSQAEAAALLATATIAASGGSHLLLGERDRVLCDPHYPKYVILRPEFAATMRAYYDFLVRYEEFLISPELEDWEHTSSSGAASFSIRGVPAASSAEVGKVWIIARRKPGVHLVHLINLTDQADVAWNALRTAPETLHNLDLSVDGLPAVRQVLLLVPDVDTGKPLPLTWRQEAGKLHVSVPRLTVWAVIACVLEDGGTQE
ncbi:MAG TPA: glycoside hydrolase family 66 protein [Chloroflexia bacterium]|nr:glycoside hydrolase family 66 protein [Chloroflexia bacterium]